MIDGSQVFGESDMSQPPSSPSWPAWLLAIIAVGPPATALVAFLPTITRNPLVAGALLLAYWVLLGLAAYLKKVWERRGDAWADAGAGRLEKLLRLLFAHAHRR